MFSHYIVYFTDRRRDGTQLSACHEWVTVSDHSTEPTCPKCQAFLEGEEADLNALREMTPDPALLVETRLGNPTAGYKPRGER